MVQQIPPSRPGPPVMSAQSILFRELVRILLENGVQTEAQMCYCLLDLYGPLLGDRAAAHVAQRLEYIRQHKLAPWALSSN